MVSDNLDSNHTGNEVIDNDKLILKMILKSKRVSLPKLMEKLVDSGTMSKSTLHRHLSKLYDSKMIDQYTDGRNSIYCVRGEGPIEKKSPSGVDTYLLEEMKKLVSDIIASGLVWSDLMAKKAELEYEKDQRNELSKRAFSLYWAVNRIEEQRTYSLPMSATYGDSTSTDFDAAIEWVTRVNIPDSHSIMSWLNYYIDAIDLMSRSLGELAKKTESTELKGR